MRSPRLMMIQKKKLQETKNSTQNFQFHYNNNENNNNNNKPYFFKIIVNPLDQKQQLRIPLEFVKKYGVQLSDDEIYLSVKNSEKPWKVKLSKDINYNVILRKGWKEFMEFYNLEYGNLLVFRFNGGLSKTESNFHVVIFDKTCVEIDYPVRSCSNGKAAASTSTKKRIEDEVEDEDENDVSVEILEQNCSTMVGTTIVEVVDDDDEEDECSSYKGKGSINFGNRKKAILKRLDEYKSPNPHFKTIMYPSNVRHTSRCKRSVPYDHAAKYFRSKTKEIILRGPNGKTNVARYYVGKTKAELGTGWRDFVLDNRLKIGDACVFELNRILPYCYDVTIFRC